LVVWLFDCLIVWLFLCLVLYLFSCTICVVAKLEQLRWFSLRTMAPADRAAALGLGFWRYGTASHTPAPDTGHHSLVERMLRDGADPTVTDAAGHGIFHLLVDDEVAQPTFKIVRAALRNRLKEAATAALARKGKRKLKRVLGESDGATTARSKTGHDTYAAAVRAGATARGGGGGGGIVQIQIADERLAPPKPVKINDLHLYNSVDNAGKTPLHWAAVRSAVSLVGHEHHSSRFIITVFRHVPSGFIPSFVFDNSLLVRVCAFVEWRTVQSRKLVWCACE
jgi:hypothetical protein